jgi:hypothetical protein
MTIPAMASVYRAFDAKGRLLYVGQSAQVSARMATHRRSSKWASQAVRWDISEPMPRDTALDVEAVAIYTERPLHNVANKNHLGGVYDRWEKNSPASGRAALRVIGEHYFQAIDILESPVAPEAFTERVKAAIAAAQAERPELADADIHWAVTNWFGPPILAGVNLRAAS